MNGTRLRQLLAEWAAEDAAMANDYTEVNLSDTLRGMADRLQQPRVQELNEAPVPDPDSFSR